jgi:polysaccharide deacetylase family protein (PEP-CTERM system associated)
LRGTKFNRLFVKTFLFSVDFEEFYPVERQASFRRTALPELGERWLAFLRRAGMRCTFFVVGEIAERFPEAVRAIAAEGHELGCHTHTHRPLNEHTPASLREDLLRNLDAVRACAKGAVIGFRAPILSLTRETAWAYEVLAELGFQYSSSVLPARNPLHGWAEFGAEPRRVNGVTEIPVTLARVGPARVPVGAGTYFRCLPMPLIRRAFAGCARRGEAVVCYFHPYDIDTAQERVMSRGVNGSRLMNALLYVNRGRTIERLESLIAGGFKIVTYSDFLASH